MVLGKICHIGERNYKFTLELRLWYYYTILLRQYSGGQDNGGAA